MKRVTMPSLAVLIAATLFAAGCTSNTTKPDKAESASDKRAVAAVPNKVVQDRAVQRWELLIAGKADKAYDYLSPGYRATKKRQDYARELSDRPVQWKKVLPYREVCDKPDVCLIDLQIDAGVKMPGVSSMVSTVGFVTETWIRVHGKWYFLPEANAPTGRR
ncbi:MAG: hypothetical protein WC000_05255 [Dokdonella sp.]